MPGSRSARPNANRSVKRSPRTSATRLPPPSKRSSAAGPCSTNSRSRSESSCTCTTKSASAASYSTTSKPRIRERRQDAEALIGRLSVRYGDIAATLDLALEILNEDLHELYRRADDSIRRLINQAIFNALYVCDETITAAELAEPFAALRALHDAIRRLPAGNDKAARRQRCPATTEDPGPCRDGAPSVLVRLTNIWCPGWDSNPQALRTIDFKSTAYTYSATRAAAVYDRVPAGKGPVTTA